MEDLVFLFSITDWKFIERVEFIAHMVGVPVSNLGHDADYSGAFFRNFPLSYKKLWIISIISDYL
jgi:hypothetical protein